MTSKWFKKWFGPAPEEMPVESNLVRHAQEELTRAGLFDEDADYGGDIGGAVLELVKVLASQGHSGGSHFVTLSAFNKVANFESLTPITNDPNEWFEYAHGEWQNRRQSSLFSTDGGKTYYDVNEKMTGHDLPVHTSKEYTSA